MRNKKFPKDIKARRKLMECLLNEGWDPFDVCLLIGYSTKKFDTKIPRRFNSFHHMIQDDDYRLRTVNYYLEKYDIKDVP